MKLLLKLFSFQLWVKKKQGRIDKLKMFMKDCCRPITCLDHLWSKCWLSILHESQLSGMVPKVNFSCWTAIKRLRSNTAANWKWCQLRITTSSHNSNKHFISFTECDITLFIELVSLFFFLMEFWTDLRYVILQQSKNKVCLCY